MEGLSYVRCPVMCGVQLCKVSSYVRCPVVGGLSYVRCLVM